MLPKVESVDDVRWADALLTDLERASSLGHRIGLELQIESARGLDRVSDIAAASERNETLVLGPGDLMASLGTPELRVGGLVTDYPGDFWHYFLARIVVAARASGLQPIDGPYGAIRDLDGLRVAARRSALLGCDGKWALTPGQIEVINEAFTPRREDVARAVAILDAYRTATDDRRTGAVMFDGEMIDEASRKMSQVIVDRARLFGLLTD
jgi:citrate lyase subunit beta/citryl-CoA lyase